MIYIKGCLIKKKESFKYQMSNTLWKHGRFVLLFVLALYFFFGLCVDFSFAGQMTLSDSNIQLTKPAPATLKRKKKFPH
jgi:hypothetical protein